MPLLDGLSLVAFAIALFASVMTALNLRRLPAAPDPGSIDGKLPALSVAIPARNEAANIEACIRSVLGGGIENVRVYIYDDQSEDDTPAILKRLADADPRIRPVQTQPMPAGWCGKQHACWRLAQAAMAESESDDSWMLFIDADVRIEPDGLRRTLAHAGSLDHDGQLGLLSTFPRQITRSMGEALLVTSIFFILLSYLPFGRMRRTLDPAASAACGQFMLVKQSCYTAFGGHESLKDSMHDGVKMPRLARQQGFRTDLFDGPDIVNCRMYEGFGAAWRGFAKNAYEGLGSPVLLVVLTVLHLIGHILPPVLFAVSVTLGVTGQSVPWIAIVASGGATLLGIAHRLVIATRERHTVSAAPLHAVGVLLMTAVQWWSLYLHLTGRRSWRGRTLQQVSPQ